MRRLKFTTIHEVHVGPGEETLAFVTDEGVFLYNTYGDCCSETWFSDIYNFDALVGAKVREVEEYLCPDYDVDDGRCRQDVDEAYGIQLVTDKGTAAIVFRNSSNGYYGGQLAGVAKVDRVPEGFTRIEDDWRA